MEYELKEIGISDLEEASKLAWRLYQNPETASYPRYMTSCEQMYEHLKKLVDNKDDEVVVCYEGENIVGVMGCFKEIDEKYIQTTAYYVDKDYDKVTDLFIDYIKNKHKGFELLMGFPKENKLAVNYFETRGYECIESSCRCEQSPKNLNYIEAGSGIVLVGDGLKDEYIAFHKKMMRICTGILTELTDSLINLLFVHIDLTTKLEQAI